MDQNTSQTRRIYSLRDFSTRHPSFSVGVLRNLVWKAKDRRSSLGTIKGNGLETAIVRLGRRLYLDEPKFFEWLDGQQGKGFNHAA